MLVINGKIEDDFLNKSVDEYLLNRQKIIICGAGGIGSNLAVMLVRSGLKILALLILILLNKAI
ncbi:ThiF family adenylyltransferase [Campylobacter pinnipediorum]|uniref:ThiF family adenylyltransferase n=1 Tax=Campylobacter pinnipediorum TaxID=1965231 RepID=UPI000995B4AF|nr:ThiF family adenylyltransferase [Campylobacter pinnipediorum]